MKTTCPHCWGSGTVADEQLSPNFRLSEFLRSDTARELGIPNAPSATHCIALRILARELLQPLRDRFGPIRVTSGFRAPELNAAVDGSPKSVHLHGLAADIVPIRATVDEVMAYLVESDLRWDQAIDEEHLHLGLYSPDGEQRRQMLRKVNGDYVAWKGQVA